MQLVPFDRCEKLQLSASLKREGDVVEIAYAIAGDTGEIVIPPADAIRRGEGLWRATCFHAFVSLGKTSYLELDFSPSGEWAAYRFTDYRQGMREHDIDVRALAFDHNRAVVTIDLSREAESGARVGLASTIEHRSGIRSYWALAHPCANRPDFHARDCFVAQLP